MTTRSFLIGTTFGAACALFRIALQRFFGVAPDVQVPLLLVGAAAFVLGLRGSDSLRGPFRSLVERVSLRTALLAFGAWVALGACLAVPAGRAVAWAGGGISAGWLALALARALVAIPLLAPPAWLFGLLVRASLQAIPEGPIAARSASAAMAGAFAGIFGISVVEQVPRGTQAAAALLMIALASFAILEKRLAILSREEEEADERDLNANEPARPAPTFLGMVRGLFYRKPVLPACAAGMAAILCSFAATRFFLFAFGNDLGGFPVATLVLLAGCAAGAALTMLLPHAWLRERGAQAAAAAICICVVFVVWTWMRFDQFPPRFLEWTQTKIPFISLVANAGRAIGPRVVFAGLLLGFTFAALAHGLPANRTRRERWLLETGALAIGGFFAGLWILGQQLPHAHWEGAVKSAALVAGLIAALGIALAGRFNLATGLAGAFGALLVVLSVRSAPLPLRDALLVERNLPSGNSSAPAVLKSWLIFDEDEWNSSFAVLRRGHGRRLLVNGRNEVSNESVKSHGLLAHLPLLLHPNPRTVLVLGSSNGLALRAALAHPVDRVECFETGRAPVRATARFGIEAESALRDSRLGIRLGDFEDLLARSPRADVILSQTSGAWSERSSRTCTREFLHLAKNRLADGGIFCQWVPESVLTKEGIKILFATFASVFPQVQAWSTQGGDLLLLGRAQPQSMDPVQLQSHFAACNCGASLQYSWIEDPVTFLSNYLASDATLRKIAGTNPVHERNHPRLAHEEAARRRGGVAVNPVPGLAALGDDVLTEMGAQDGSFATLVRQGVEARKLERQALDFEAGEKTYEAIDAYQRALELNPHDGSVRRSMASLRTRMGIRYVADRSFTAAHQNLRAAVETDTTFANGFANLGSLLLYTGPPDYAISTTYQAVQLEPDDDLAWTQMGHIRRKEGLLDQAIPYYEKALQLNPQNLDAAMAYVDSKLELEAKPDIAEAVRYLESFLPFEPDNEELIYRLGKYRDALRRGYLLPPEPSSSDSTSAIAAP